MTVSRPKPRHKRPFGPSSTKNLVLRAISVLFILKQPRRTALFGSGSGRASPSPRGPAVDCEGVPRRPPGPSRPDHPAAVPSPDVVRRDPVPRSSSAPWRAGFDDIVSPGMNSLRDPKAAETGFRVVGRNGREGDLSPDGVAFGRVPRSRAVRSRRFPEPRCSRRCRRWNYRRCRRYLRNRCSR